jgi:2-phosphosulfolactate phosphatase
VGFIQIQIFQGSEHKLDYANVNIVIDVIRAFTVAHYAFLAGVREIWLAQSVESAFQIKRDFPDVLLAGEVNGLPIEGFDLDNSPAHLVKHGVKKKILVQKTTNGVKAALNALNADEVYVTGFSNAKTTAQYLKHKWKQADSVKMNIIASHPTGEDDLACAEYIRDIIEDSPQVSCNSIKHQIQHASVAKKFYDPTQIAFNRNDMDFCLQELNSPFVMKINKTKDLPTIERVDL